MLDAMRALELEATEVGRSRGYSHAAYVDAYGGDMDEAPMYTQHFASVPTYFEAGWAEGVQDYRDSASDCE